MDTENTQTYPGVKISTQYDDADHFEFVLEQSKEYLTRKLNLNSSLILDELVSKYFITPEELDDIRSQVCLLSFIGYVEQTSTYVYLIYYMIMFHTFNNNSGLHRPHEKA